MAATINNFISALLNPRDSFTLLSDARAQLDPEGHIAIERTTHAASCRIEWLGKEYLLSLPLSHEGVSMARSAAVKLRMLTSNILLEYRLLPNELNTVDTLGRAISSDLILQELPLSSKRLSECIKNLDATQAFAAVDKLECELRRLKLSLPNIKPENIVINEEYELYPLHLHYAEVGSETADQTAPLKEFIANTLGVEITTSTTHYDNPQEPAMYGYQRVGNPFEGMCVAENSAGYGYIATDGSEIIAPQFLWAGDMREGRAEVETAEGMGLIDAQGEFVIEPRYQIVEFDPLTGTSRAKENDEWLTFDYNGNPLDH